MLVFLLPSQNLVFVSTIHFSLCTPSNWETVSNCQLCRGNYTKHLDKVLEEAAAEFYPHVKFMRVGFLFIMLCYIHGSAYSYLVKFVRVGSLFIM